MSAGLACGCGSTPAMNFYSGDPLPTSSAGVAGFGATAGASGASGAGGSAGSFSGSAGASGSGVAGAAGSGGCSRANAVPFPNQVMINNSGDIPDEGGCYRIDHPNNGFNTVGCSNWVPAERILRVNGMDVPDCSSPSRTTYPGPMNGNDYFEIGAGTPSFTKGSIFWYTQ